MPTSVIEDVENKTVETETNDDTTPDPAAAVAALDAILATHPDEDVMIPAVVAIYSPDGTGTHRHIVYALYARLIAQRPTYDTPAYWAWASALTLVSGSMGGSPTQQEMQLTELHGRLNDVAGPAKPWRKPGVRAAMERMTAKRITANKAKQQAQPDARRSGHYQQHRPHTLAAFVRDVLAKCDTGCYLNAAGVLADLNITHDGRGELLRTSVPGLIEIVSRTADLTGDDPKNPLKFIKIALPKSVAEMVIERPDGENLGTAVPTCLQILHRPILTPSGNVVTCGYDRETLSWVIDTPDTRGIVIPDEPTEEDAKEALAEIMEVVEQFPFADKLNPDKPLNKAAWVAMLLTAVGRQMIDGPVPLMALSANTRGSGKTLLVDVIHRIAEGGCVPAAAWPDDEAEMNKVLTAVAIEGRAVRLFDNIPPRTELQSGPLEAVLTSGAHSGRVLGVSRTTAMPMRTVFFATGNNLRIAGDTSRRVLVCRLESEHANPEDRTDIKEKNLAKHVSENRKTLLAAALTILRAHRLAKPDSGAKTQGSYETWCTTIAAAVCWVGLPDPVNAFASRRGDQTDDELDTVAAILAEWDVGLTVGRGLPRTIGAIIDAVAPIDTIRGIRSRSPDATHHPMYEALTAISPRLDQKRIAQHLSGYEGRWIDKQRLVREAKKETSTRRTLYKVETKVEKKEEKKEETPTDPPAVVTTTTEGVEP